MAMQNQTLAIQTEEIQPGDRICEWMPGRDATVLTVTPRFTRVEVTTDAVPSRRSYIKGRTITVLRREEAEF
jgi:hypothetical protein